MSGWIAVLTAAVLIASPSSRALATAAASWLKVTPGPMALGAIIDRATRRQTIFALTILPAASFILAPFAWIDFATLLPNLAARPPRRLRSTSRRRTS